MKLELKDNWNFLLADSLLRGTWFIQPELAFNSTEQILSILDNKIFGASTENRLEYYMSVSNGSVISGLKESFDKSPKNSVAIFPIQGSMMKDGTFCTYGMSEIEQFMQMAANHKNIVGAVLDIHSGGGSTAAVAPILRGIDEFKSKNKPVIASADVCCSAAYWAASACDFIMADNTISSEFGSIGVMMQFIDMMPALEASGRKVHTIYAPESSDKNAAFELALKGEYDKIKTEMLSPLAQNFQKNVKANRGSKLNLETPGILSGKTFFAEEALKIGFIDGIGNLSKAIQLALELA